MTTHQLMTAGEVAEQLGVSLRTVQRQAEAGVLEPLGKLRGGTGAYVFTEQSIDALKRERDEK